MSLALPTPAYGNSGEEKPPPVPKVWYTGDGISIPGGGTVVLFTHPDKHGVFRLTGRAPLQFKQQVACGETACVYNHLDWSLFAGEAVSACGTNESTCDVRVGTGYGWSGVMVRQNNNPPLIYLLWNSGKPGGTISGYVTDLDHVGVPGASVTASGPRGGTSAVQGGSGFYSINVTTGDYLVAPSGVPAGAGDAQYKPRHARVSVPPDGAASADFSLDAGLKVTLKLAQASVPADGMTVVKGTLTTKEYGKPVPNVGILLEPKPALGYDAAVMTGARVAICNSYGGRIWPTGPGGGAALPTPSGRPVDVVTDQDGNYDFTLTVGTVPGPFELSAWAKSTWTGELIAGDVAWDERTLTLTAPGSVKYDAFLTTLSALHGTTEAGSALGTMVNDAESIAQALAELGRSRNMLGGLAFSMVDGSAGGPAVLVYDDDSPPTVKANGDVVAGGRTWVLSPGEWKGTAKLGGVLSTVVQTGKLQWAPTYTEWAKGTQVQGWSLSKNSASLGTTELQYNGWAYPSNPAGPPTPGACY